ncbi:MAG: hypothetical protein V7L29_07855 [Nostoc sp.]|uniref:hypothetical protein n=1 Tax=Nostoc sp. TaxID=1180 RepID=UPI002FF6D46C
MAGAALVGRKEGAGAGTIAGGYLPISGVAPHTGEGTGDGNVGVAGCASAEGDGYCVDTTPKPHLSPRCFHLAGNGGMKAAVREVAAHLSENAFVFRTDVKGYYASIDQEILFEMVRKYVNDPQPPFFQKRGENLKPLPYEGRSLERGF